MRVLGIDTATENCSAALLIGTEVQGRAVEVDRGHAERILPMVDELLAEAGMTLGQLDAIAFGRGPGSFTGVRLAASVTQGLAFGAGLPVLPVSDLQALAQQLLRSGSDAGPTPLRVLVCNDARMQEVYWACFEQSPERLMQPVGAEHVGPPQTVTLPEGWHNTVGAGRGFEAYEALRQRLGAQLIRVAGGLLPDAREIVALGAADYRAGRSLPPEQALPVYLRDDVARPA